MNTRLILASASERRRRILSSLQVDFEIVVPEVQEVPHADNPRGASSENALRKNLWCREARPGHFIISADTTIDFDGRCIEKPVSMDEASEFLRMFSDTTHTVITAVAFSTPTSAPEVHIVESSVTFLPLTPATIRKYFSRVDPMDKAGAYDIDQCGDTIIRSYAGSRTNIMGLPKELVDRWLRDQRLL